MTENRNKLKQWFITLPQWTNVPDLTWWEKILPKSSYGKVTKELHEDGNFHYHIIVKLQGNGLTKTQMVGFFEKTFPTDYKRIHIRAVRSVSHAIKYLDKAIVDTHKWGRLFPIPAALQEFFDDWTADANFRAWEREQDRIRHAAIIREVFERENPECLFCSQRIACCCDYWPSSVDRYTNLK